MTDAARATVSVVTPFYNTAAYLAECIESVLAQSYQDFEYLLVDNQSSDGSARIAQEYAQRDPRIRLIRTPKFYDQVQNYNYALEQIAPAARYCKVVQADDWVFPRCLAEMVELADAHPQIAIVSAYEHNAGRVLGTGLPPTQTVISGREACRLFLVGGVYMFGSPTTLMYRADIVRSRRPFYEAGRAHEDTEVVFEILADQHAFGMVHQVLTYTRVRADSISGSTRDFAPDALDRLILVKRFGERCLSAPEYQTCLQGAERFYYGSLVREFLSHPSKRFWQHHKQGLANAHEELDPVRVARHLGAAALENLMPPALLRGLKR